MAYNIPINETYLYKDSKSSFSFPNIIKHSQPLLNNIGGGFVKTKENDFTQVAKIKK